MPGFVDPYGRGNTSRGGKRKEQHPKNTRLWDMLVAQAKTKFDEYPSIPASKWVHEQYVSKGGTFVSSVTEDDAHRKKDGGRKGGGDDEERESTRKRGHRRAKARGRG